MPTAPADYQTRYPIDFPNIDPAVRQRVVQLYAGDGGKARAILYRPPRGNPRWSSQSTAGSSNALIIRASKTGTTMTSSFAISHSSATAAAKMTSKRHDQAAVLRTRGSTEASSRVADIGQA